MRHFLIFAVLIACLIWVVAYGLGPAVNGSTSPAPNAVDGLAGAIARGITSGGP